MKLYERTCVTTHSTCKPADTAYTEYDSVILCLTTTFIFKRIFVFNKFNCINIVFIHQIL